jgi:hypothetical protein
MKGGEMQIFSRSRRLALVALTVMIACIAALAAPSSRADYGASALYQIELSANNVGGVPGKGLWLWIELDLGGGGNFAGAGCKHNGSTGPNTATPQSGDVTNWTDDGTNLHITLDLLISGAPKTFTFTVPDTFGHYSGPTSTYMSPNTFGGDTQLTVAP